MSSRRSPRTPKCSGKLRVGFITPSLGVGGAERWVLTLCRTMTAVAVTGIMSWDANGVLSAEARKMTRVFWPSEAASFFDGCDVVIAWGTRDLSKLAAGFKGRLIGCSHGASLQPFHAEVCAEMISMPGCTLAAVSDAAAWTFPEGLDVKVIPNGVEVDRCTPRVPARVIREELGIPPQKKIALFLGRLATEKRPWLLAEAVMGMDDEWVAVIGGSDIEGVGVKLPKHPRVIQIRAVEHPGSLLNAADAFVLPSLTEAHPLALTEAWIAGIPTVYCDWPFAAQMRREHGFDLGVVVPVFLSPEVIADALRTSQTAWGQMKVNFARKIAWEHYTASAMAARWEEFLGVASKPCTIISHG